MNSRPAHVFLFVNPTSGGNAGYAFTDSELDEATFKEPHVKFSLFDIREGISGSKPGFLRLKSLLDSDTVDVDEDVRVIAAGGDGTVMWCAGELWAHGIDDPRIVIGVVPYGTGNDFARALKWDDVVDAKTPFEDRMKNLRTLCTLWIKAPVVSHDVWDIVVDLHEGGMFKKIDGKTRQKQVIKDADAKPKTCMSYKMNNYFSMGIESRIGVGFDRNRKTNATRNKLVYVTEGIKKVMFGGTVPVHETLSYLATKEGGEEKMVFETDSAASVTLKQTHSLVVSNIPSFASGLDIWKSSQGKPLGISSGPPGLSNVSQRVGDGRIEFLAFSTAMGIGLEQAFQGNGRRIHQGCGPFTFRFKPLPVETRIYYQVDGEFYVVNNPDTIKIQLDKKLRVILNTEDAVPDTFVSASSPPKSS